MRALEIDKRDDDRAILFKVLAQRDFSPQLILKLKVERSLSAELILNINALVLTREDECGMFILSRVKKCCMGHYES